MLGSKLKSWMESKVAKVRQSKPRGWRRDDLNSSGVPSSCSNDTSIILGGGSSIGSFTTQNLSSPDTGYSTDGYSPKTHHPPLPFTPSVAPSATTVSKTSLLTQVAQSRGENPPNQFLSVLTSIRRHDQQSPQKPPRLSKIKQQIELEQENTKTLIPAPRNSISSSGDSGQGTLGSNRHSGESYGQFRFPNICEEPRETEILSDWAPTDEDVDEGVLTPTPTPPPLSTSPDPCQSQGQGHTFEYKMPPSDELPKAYETLQLLNQCNHVFPLPSCTGPRCLQARLDMNARVIRKHGKSSGPFGFLKRIFRRKSSIERELPENSRGKPIRTGPASYWLTPTPNSFRRRHVDVYVSTTIPKGVKSDIIRLPQTTPTTLPNSTATPTMTRQSPFLSRLNSNAASPASVRFKPQQIVTPLNQSPRPVVAFAIESDPLTSPRPPQATIQTTNRITLPTFNNYSPIHRLVVTTGVHQHHIHRPAPESPLVRTQSHRPPPPPPPPRQPITPTLTTQAGNPRFQYIPSSNQNSPILNHVTTRTPAQNLEIKTQTHYYSSPLVQNSCHPRNYSTHQGVTFDIDRIYERVEGTEVSDEGDGEGGDYEWDVSLAESEQSVSQDQESSRSRHSQSSIQTYQAHVPFRPPPPQPTTIQTQQNRIPPMAWGTRLSELEVKLLEKETDLKYRKLLWEAEVLLRQFTGGDTSGANGNVFKEGRPRMKGHHREINDECPQSDPLRRKSYDCWALRRLQQEMALSCASPPVLHRSRHNLHQNPHNPTTPNHHHHPSPSFRI